MTPARAAIYARISRDPEGTHLGTDRQTADCRALCLARGWEVGSCYTDDDISAHSGRRRPGYEAMLAALAAGEVNALVAYAPDRFYRRLADLVGFLDAVKQAGADVATVSGGYVDLNSPEGRFSAVVVGGAAAYEVDKTVARIKRQQLEAAKDGKPHWGSLRPYGFQLDRVTHDEHEAANIREATASLLAGDSLRSVCKRLSDRGDLTVTGVRWDSPHLTKMLLRPRMVGKREYHGRLSTAVWRPIIGDSDQERLRLAVKARSTMGRGAPRRSLLGGVLVCGVCGAKLKRCHSTRGTDTYECPADRGGNRGGKQCVSVIAEKAEAYITSVVLAVSDDLPVEQPGPTRVVIDTTALLDAREVEAATGFADGRISMLGYQTITQEIERQRVTAMTQMARTAEADAQATEVRRLAGRLRSLWPTMTTDERRQAIVTVLGTITLARAGHTLDVPLRRPTTADDLLAARFSFDVVSADHLALL